MTEAITYSATPFIHTDWREILALRVQKLSISELVDAFSAAEVVLGGKTDASIQNTAESLVQLVAQAGGPKGGNGAANSPALDPRAIYCLYSNSFSSSAVPGSFSLVESLAVGTLVALGRACDVIDSLKSQPKWVEIGKVLALASSFGEWMYIASNLPHNGKAFELLFPGQVRAVAKKKASAKASKKAKKGWADKLDPEKQKVFETYEAGKPWPSTKAAAEKIWGDAVTTAVGYDKLYKWLLAYVKGKAS
ncbi:MAG: hypothetical protein M0T84_04135 [Betaproteobacteria bacterium]|nr:hypothetical protein [Betaproteobacteria bacterium]